METVAALFTFFALTASGEALACSCDTWGRTMAVSPAANATDVPMNAKVRWFTRALLPPPLALRVDGDPIAVDDELEEFSVSYVRTLTPVQPLPAGATVEVVDPDTETVLFVFDVGDAVDESPPRWDAIDVESWNRNVSTCGRIRAHSFSFRSLEDDHWPVDEIQVIGIPSRQDLPSFTSVGDVASVANSMCGEIDPTLESRFHRAYTFLVVDGSGNVARSDAVRTGRGCGCAAGPPAAVPPSRRGRVQCFSWESGWSRASGPLRREALGGESTALADRDRSHAHPRRPPASADRSTRPKSVDEASARQTRPAGDFDSMVYL